MNTRGLCHLTGWAFCILLQVESSRYASANSLQLLTAPGPGQAAPAGGAGDSGAGIVTSDGRFVVFASRAKNLISAATNQTGQSTQATLDVYLRDRSNGVTSLVSVDLSARKGGNGDSLPLAVSTNGQYVLFESLANNLVNGDTNQAADVFVRDMVAGRTLLVSANTNGVPGNAISRKAAMTPDGRFVAFLSSATDLIQGDTNNLPDAFVRDMVSGVTTLVSTGTGRPAGPNQQPVPELAEPAPEITPDGRYVVFQQTTNLSQTGIFVHDSAAQTTLAVSAEALALIPSILGNTNPCRFDYAISDDSRYIAFEASPIGSGAGVVFRYALSSGNTEVVYTNAAYLSVDDRSLDLSSNGEVVAFVANANGSNGGQLAVMIWDSLTGVATLVSSNVNQTASAGAVSCNPALTPDGRLVAFVSDAPDLLSNTVSARFHLYLHDHQTGTTTLADAVPQGMDSGLTGMVLPSLSADGHLVVFDAADSDLVPNDNNHSADVFAHDFTRGTTELISARVSTLPSLSADASSELSAEALSSDGRFLVFSSAAANLVAGDTNGFIDVFVRDLAGGSNTLVSTSLASDGADGPSADQMISSDGRYVAFDSSADNLVAGDTNHATDVFVRDLQTGTTTLASVNAAGTGAGNKDSFLSRFSANGRYVLFRSLSSDLISGLTFKGINLFWRDLQVGKTYAVTSNGIAGAVYGNPLSPTAGATMTPDGRYVFFIAPWLTSSTTAALYVWDSVPGAIIYTNVATGSSLSLFLSELNVSPDSRWVLYSSNGLYALDWRVNTSVLIDPAFRGSISKVQFSADSRFLVYSSTSPDSPAARQVTLWVLQSGLNRLVSQSFATGKGANGNSARPMISSDGGFIAYSSTATDLVPGATNGMRQVYLFDVLGGTTTLLSASSFGPFGGAGNSSSPVLSADGRTVVFQSTAPDLTQFDFSDANNLFAFVSTSGAPTPFSVSAAPLLGNPQISWPIVPGVGYQVQFKNLLSDPVWQNLTAPISIIGNRAVLNDLSATGVQRFYRIIAKP